MDLAEIWEIVDCIRSKSSPESDNHVVSKKCDCGVEIQDTVNGDIICLECGMIKSERVQMAQEQFDSNDNRVLLESSKDEFFENKQVSTRIGRTWGIKHAPSNLFKKLHQHTSINQHQLCRSKEFAEIERMCESLSTTAVVANSAKHYFNDLCKLKTFRGINRTAMKGCVILRALKDNNVSRDVSEMLSACRIDKKTILTRNIKIYEEIYGCKLLQENKCQEVYRYLQRLGIQDKQIYQLSNKIISKREQYNEQLKTSTEEVKSDLAEAVDKYMTYCAEEWTKENELAIERGLRSEMTENFIEGLKTLFVEHYVDVPEDKYDVIDELANRLDEMEAKLDGEVSKNMEITEELDSLKRSNVIREACKDLTESQTEKMVSLSNGVDFTDVEDFQEKVSELKEAYFPVEGETIAEETVVEEGTGELSEDKEPVLDPQIARYSDALSKLKPLG